MNSCIWATAQLSKDEDDFKRMIPNVEVQKIPTIFETVQTQVRNLKFRDQDIHGLSEQVNWADGHWRNYSLLDNRIANQVSSNVYVFSDSVLCLDG